MPAYTVTDGTNTFPLAEMEISYTGVELDEAQFTISGVIALDASITIYADTTIQFVGYVKDVEEIEQGALYKYTAYEKAVELKTMPYLSSTLDIFTKTSTTVVNHITDILTSAPDSGWDLAAGMVDATSLTINFYMVNRLQAINKILREMRGYYVLFDSSAKTVKFLNGTDINTDRSASDIVYVTKTLVSSSMLRGITQVVVIGKDSTVRGTYGSSASSRAYYQVDDITSNDEALKIATAIAGDIGVLFAKYKVTVDPSQIQYDVRDKIQVDGSDYWITDIIQSMDDIVLTIDDGKTSVIDSLGNRIHKIDGNFPAGSDQQWNGGSQNLGTDNATFKLDIKDVNLISNFILKVGIAAYKKTVTTSTTTDYLSDVSQVTSSTNTTGTITPMDNPYNYPSGSYFTVSGMTNGYQFGSVQCTFDMFGQGSVTRYVGLKIQYSYDTSTWYDAGGYIQFALSWDGTYQHVVPITISALFPGDSQNRNTYIRCLFYPVSGVGTVSIYSYGTITVSRVTRHLHSVPAQTDDTGTSGSPPTNVYLLTANGTSLNFPFHNDHTETLTSYLVTGTNILVFGIQTAGDKCSINPTATYQTLGKS